MFNPFGGSIRPMGDHLEGVEYRRGDITALAGSSYLCMIPQLAGELAADLALGRWMVLAQKGEGGSGEGGGDGSGNFYVTGLWPHQIKDIAAAEGGPSETRIGFAIPKNCRLVGGTARLIYAPGVGKTVDVFSRGIPQTATAPTRTSKSDSRTPTRWAWWSRASVRTACPAFQSMPPATWSWPGSRR